MALLVEKPAERGQQGQPLWTRGGFPPREPRGPRASPATAPAQQDTRALGRLLTTGFTHPRKGIIQGLEIK